ncbi:MAG: hypothetical protein P0S95_01515 [Rhabdochlamydiaceae bacterium]|nr:hypothetical protein [Candidatus Amphrikana amoebophyrae]
MSKYTSFHFDKLVRDKALQDLMADGVLVQHQHLSNCEFPQKLKERMVQDTQDILNESNREIIIEKLADLKQVALSLMNELDIHEADIEKTRIHKSRKRGAFEKATYIEKVMVEKGSKHEQHFLSNPDRYPVFE